jgi:hypothetical protein
MVQFTTQAITPPLSDEFPSDLPTIFADGIMNLANSAQIVKCYLFRVDPGVKDVTKAYQKPCAQIVMPLDALVNTYVFLEGAIEKLRGQGFISIETVETARKALRGA